MARPSSRESFCELLDEPPRDLGLLQEGQPFDAVRAHERDLIVVRAERRARIGDVIGDDEIELLVAQHPAGLRDRKSTRLNSSHTVISYAVFCLKKKKRQRRRA